MPLKILTREKLEIRLEDVDSRLRSLKTRAHNLQSEARLDYKLALKELEKQRSKLGGQISEMISAGKRAPAQLNQGVDLALKEIEDILESIGEHFSRT